MCIRDRLVSVDELEKEWRESLKGEWRQRAHFPGVVDEVEASRVFSKNKGFLKVFLVDESDYRML